jgi:general secretion pathway protein L
MMPADRTAAASAAVPTSARDRFGGWGVRVRGISGLWNWWLRALATWMPARLRALFGLARERLLLQPDGDSLRLSLERGDERRELGQVPWLVGDAGADALAPDAIADDPLVPLLAHSIVDLPRWLLLPAASGLRRSLVLPAAAADRLRDVLAFEIDRQTPFTAAGVHYDARVTGRRGDGQLEAELVVVPRDTLDAALAGLGALTGSLTGVDMAGRDGRALGVNLLPGAQRRRRADPWRAWNLALGAVAVIALAAGLWQMLANREAAADAFEATTTRHVNEARRVAIDKRRLVDTVEGLRFLQATRAGRPTTVEVLDELSRRLPDSTYLEKLSIEDDRLLLIGLSGEASALVQRLEGSRLWRSPALTGALQPDPRTGRDRFTLTAELAIAAAAGNGSGGAPNQESASARRDP